MGRIIRVMEEHRYPRNHFLIVLLGRFMRQIIKSRSILALFSGAASLLELPFYASLCSTGSFLFLCNSNLVSAKSDISATQSQLGCLKHFMKLSNSSC